MQMAKRITLLSALLLAAVGCEEKLTAPAACPEFCPSENLEVIDSVFTGSIVRDSAFRGYVFPSEASRLQVIGPGGALESRALVQVNPFSERIGVGGRDTSTVNADAVDSFRIDIPVVSRSAGTALSINVYRLPAGTDTSAGFSDLDTLFTSANLLATVAVPDTLESGTVSATVAGTEFPSFVADDRVIVLGLSAAGGTSPWVKLGSEDEGNSVSVIRFVTAMVAGADSTLSDGRTAGFDTYVANRPPPDVDGHLVVGGSPSARSLLRVQLPTAVVDSSDVIRATLLLLPTAQAQGVPGDSFVVRANPLSADFGPKSPIVLPNILSTDTSMVTIAVGTSDTVRLDITTIVRSWRADTTAPRSIMLQAVPEGADLAEISFGSSLTPGFEPRLKVAFVPAVKFGRGR